MFQRPRQRTHIPAVFARTVVQARVWARVLYLVVHDVPAHLISVQFTCKSTDTCYRGAVVATNTPRFLFADTHAHPTACIAGASALRGERSRAAPLWLSAPPLLSLAATHRVQVDSWPSSSQSQSSSCSPPTSALSTLLPPDWLSMSDMCRSPADWFTCVVSLLQT